MLSEILDLSFPEESLAVVDERVRGRSSREGLAGRSQCGGEVRQEAALGRRELSEVAAEERVHAGEGSDVVGGVVLPLRRGRDCAPGRALTMLTSSRMSHRQSAMRRAVSGLQVVSKQLLSLLPESLVQRLAADVRRVRGLEGGHLEVDALHVAEQLLEEFPPHEVEHVRLARAGTPVQQPEQRLFAVSCCLVRWHEPVFDQHSLHDQLQELALLRVEAASHVVADQPLAQKPFADPSEGVGGGSSARVVQSLHCDRRFLLVSVAGFARVPQHALRADDAVWPVEDDPLSMLSGLRARSVSWLARPRR